VPNSPLYLVTGGCGFIGSHLVEALLARGARVRVLDNLSTGRRENLAAVADRVELVVGDIGDEALLARCCAGVTAIAHLAALVSVADSVARPADNHRINFTGTLNVLQAARAAGNPRVVLASTAAIYGNDPALPKRESMPPAAASPYAAAKLAGEHALRIFHQLYGLPAVSLRFFNVYGPRQDPRSPYSGVISRFVDALRRGETPVIFGDGLQTRDFISVFDIVRAIVSALTLDLAADGAVYNVATGRATSLLDLLNALASATGRSVAPRFAEARAGDVRHSVADISAAETALRFQPTHALRVGLAALLKETA